MSSGLKFWANTEACATTITAASIAKRRKFFILNIKDVVKTSANVAKQQNKQTKDWIKG
jgi:predicted glycosyltransferase